MLTINNNSRDERLTHLTTKIVVLNHHIENTLSNIAIVSNNINIDILYIMSIVIDDKCSCEIIEYTGPSKIIYIEMSIEYFMEKMLDDQAYDFWRHNKNTLYLLRNGNFSDLTLLFTSIDEKKVRIVKGNSQKSHLISPMDLRLSSYMLILYNMDYKKLYKLNAFNNVSKDKYLSFIQEFVSINS